MKMLSIAGLFSRFRKPVAPKIDKQHTWPRGANTVRILVDSPIGELGKGVYALSKMSFSDGEVLYSVALSKVVFSEEELEDWLAQKKFRVIVSSDGPIGLLSRKAQLEDVASDQE